MPRWCTDRFCDSNGQPTPSAPLGRAGVQVSFSCACERLRYLQNEKLFDQTYLAMLRASQRQRRMSWRDRQKENRNAA